MPEWLMKNNRINFPNVFNYSKLYVLPVLGLFFNLSAGCSGFS